MLKDFWEFSSCNIFTTLHTSCTTPHQRLSTVASHTTLIHTIFLYGLLPGHFIHSTHVAKSIFTTTTFTYTKWGVRHITTNEYCRVFDVSTKFDIFLNKYNPDVIPPCNLLFNTVPVKLLLNGLILSGMC